MVVLVVRPSEVITTHVSMHMSMLGIIFYLYGHVLGPPRFLFNFEKMIFSHKIRPLLNCLIKKLDSKAEFGMWMPVFILRASSSPQEPLFICFGRLKHLVKHYFAKGASKVKTSF